MRSMDFTHKGGVRIFKKRIIIAASSLAVAAMMAAAGIAVSLSHEKNAEYEKARASLTQSAPILAQKPVTVGFELNILCDTDASELFDVSDDGELSRLVTLRNEHLESESGADIDVTATSDFYNAAKNDILSGTYKYDMYAAKTSGNLSRLLAEGELHDVSRSRYMNFEKGYYDEKTNKTLEVRGGRYLISSSAADARLFSKAVVYADTFDGDALKTLAKGGEFTFEAMLASGYLMREEEIYPMWFGVGGHFVSYTDEEPSFISHKNFKSTVEKLTPLENEVQAKTNVFELQTLYEVRNSDWLSILPMPKSSAGDEYGGYIDLSAAIMTAIPSGSPTVNETEYLLDRMAYLSEEYVIPYFEGCFAEEADIYEIIRSSSSCDLSVLFGYGDIGALVAECMRDGTQLSLEYYNRKALYEKALSIVAKRLKK